MAIPVTIDPGGKPKGELIKMAREFCGLAGYEWGDLTPEEEASHLRELDAMMTEWPWDQLGYNFPTYGAGLPTDSSGLAPRSVSAVTKYLGLRIAPGLGKNITPDAKAACIRSYNLLFAQTATIPSMKMARNTPRGQGAQWFQPWWPYVDETSE